MIIQDPQVQAKCPGCRSENVKWKCSLGAIVEWLGKLLGVNRKLEKEAPPGSCNPEGAQLMD